MNETQNVTLSCGLGPSFPPALGVPEIVNIIQAIVAVLAGLVSAPINIYLFIIIIKYRVLHQRSLFLSIQIIGIEILYHVTVPVVILVSTIENNWVFGEVVCDITGMIHDAFAMFRFTMTLVLTMDRFLSVYKPFFYSKHGGIVSWTLSATMWLITLVRVVVPLTGILNCYTYIPTFKTCTIYPGCSSYCEYFAAWSIGFVILCGVILPLFLYAIIFYIIRKITRYHTAIQASVSESKNGELQRKEGVRKYTNMINKRKKFVTASILLISIIGTTPAFTLYMASIFYRTPNRYLFILNMLIGRSSFNLIPLFDAIAFSRHQSRHQNDFIKNISIHEAQYCSTERSRSIGDQQFTSERRKSLTLTSTL